MDETALAFDKAVRRTGVPYAFMGAFAVMAWGEPRATTDVDTLLDYSAEDVEGLVQALEDEGLSAAAADFTDALVDGGHVSVFHEGSIFWLDVKPALTEREKRQVAEAAEVVVRDRSLRLVRPEETIAFKLAFGSPKDEQDAMSILIRQEDSLDEARLDEFAAALSVSPKLAKLRERLRR